MANSVNASIFYTPMMHKRKKYVILNTCTNMVLVTKALLFCFCLMDAVRDVNLFCLLFYYDAPP